MSSPSGIWDQDQAQDREGQLWSFLSLGGDLEDIDCTLPITYPVTLSFFSESESNYIKEW